MPAGPGGVVKKVPENRDRVNRSSRPLVAVQPADLTADRPSAPLHEGAKRRFEDADLL